jgi:hypothetical protein
MRIKLARQLSLALAVLFILSFCLLDANAQTRRRKRSRRATNPIVNNVTPVQPATPDPQIISTAEEQSKEANDNADTSPTGARRATRSRTGTPEAEQDSMRRTVNQLTDKLSQMEEQQRTLVNLERLTRAEQRAENLSAQLRDVQAKEADLQARAEQLDYALQPENLDNSLAAYGSTRPEVLREQRRRQLENERTRVRAQLDQLAASRTRLESAIANADAEADRIRQLVDAANLANTVPSDATGITTDSNAPNNTNAPPVINNSPRSAPGTSTQTDTSNSNPPL